MGWVTINGAHVLIGEDDGSQGKTAAAVFKARREKTHPTRGTMAEARREGKGKDARIVMADGSAAPEHVRAGQISEKWTEVKVSTDPKSELLVTAKDEKGRGVEVTTKGYEARRDVVKFAKTDELLANHEKIGREIQEARKDPKTKEEAEATWLIREQATRVGSNSDTKAKVKAYGATTLQARHVVESSEGVRLQFVGKKGIHHDHLIKDPELGTMLAGRKHAASSPEQPIFATNDAKVRAFMKDRDGGGFTPKDLRTGWATRSAIDEVKADPRPSANLKEHKARILAVATKVSKTLGNEPTETRDSYIDPRVFDRWRPQ